MVDVCVVIRSDGEGTSALPKVPPDLMWTICQTCCDSNAVRPRQGSTLSSLRQPRSLWQGEEGSRQWNVHVYRWYAWPTFTTCFSLLLTDNHHRLRETHPRREACDKIQSPGWATGHHWRPKTRRATMKVRVCYKPAEHTICAWKNMASSYLILLNVMLTILDLSTVWHCVINDVLFYDSRQQIILKQRKSQKFGGIFPLCWLNVLVDLWIKEMRVNMDKSEKSISY